MDLVKIPQKILWQEGIDYGASCFSGLNCEASKEFYAGDVEAANELGFMDTNETRQGGPEEFLKQCVVFPAYF